MPKKGRLPDGISARVSKATGSVSYQVRVRRVGFPSFVKTFDRLDEAKAWKAATETKLNKGEQVATTRQARYKVADAVDDFKKHLQGSESQRRYAGRIKDDMGDVAVKNLTAEFVQNYVKFKSQQIVLPPKNRTVAQSEREKKTVYEGGTVRKYFYTLKAVCEWHAAFHKYPLITPWNIIKLPPEDNARERRLLPEEEQRLLAACLLTGKGRKNGEALTFLIRIALETAMRQGELLKMEWSEVNFENRSIRLPAKKTKTRKDRVVPMTTVCSALLQEYKEKHKKEGESRVFWMWECEVPSLASRFGRLTKEAGVENFRFHDLRHEATSRFFEKGQGLTDIQIASITGHSDLRMLKRYTHLRASDLADKLW